MRGPLGPIMDQRLNTAAHLALTDLRTATGTIVATGEVLIDRLHRFLDALDFHCPGTNRDLECERADLETAFVAYTAAWSIDKAALEAKTRGHDYTLAVF